jgi:hypothetical protein
MRSNCAEYYFEPLDEPWFFDAFAAGAGAFCTTTAAAGFFFFFFFFFTAVAVGVGDAMGTELAAMAALSASA